MMMGGDGFIVGIDGDLYCNFVDIVFCIVNYLVG